MESIPKKGYFAKELALKTLFGDKAFSDLKKLMDPCCGIGIDNICIAPCGSAPSSCPALVINSVNINCGTQTCSASVTLSGYTGSAFDVSFTMLGPVSGILDIQIITDIFTLTTNGTFTIPLPGLCSIYPFAMIQIFKSLTGFLAYSPSVVVSNLITPDSGSVHITCPIIVLCPRNGDLRDCPQIVCAGGKSLLHISITASTDTTPLFRLEVSLDNGSTWNLWPAYFSPTIVNDGTPHTYYVDITGLTFPGNFFRFRVADSGGIISEESELNMTPCPFLDIAKADPGCKDGNQQISIEFDYDTKGLTMHIYAQMDFGAGYVPVYDFGSFTGSGHVGPVDFILPGTTPAGPYPIKLIGAGVESTPVIVNVISCTQPVINLTGSNVVCNGGNSILTVDFNWSNLTNTNDFVVQYYDLGTMIWSTLDVVGNLGLISGATTQMAPIGISGAYAVRVIDNITGTISSTWPVVFPALPCPQINQVHLNASCDGANQLLSAQFDWIGLGLTNNFVVQYYNGLGWSDLWNIGDLGATSGTFGPASTLIVPLTTGSYDLKVIDTVTGTDSNVVLGVYFSNCPVIDLTAVSASCTDYGQLITVSFSWSNLDVTNDFYLEYFDGASWQPAAFIGNYGLITGSVAGVGLSTSIPAGTWPIRVRDLFTGATSVSFSPIVSDCPAIIFKSLENGCDKNGNQFINVDFRWQFLGNPNTDFRIQYFDGMSWVDLINIGDLGGSPGTTTSSTVIAPPLNGGYPVRAVDLISGISSAQFNLTFTLC